MPLLPRSVYNFEEFIELFLTHFAGNMKAKKHFTHPYMVRQGNDETLWSFIAQWQTKVHVIEGLDEKSALIMFIESL